MRKLTFAQATLEAMAEEMKKDDKVYVIGEDIARQGDQKNCLTPAVPRLQPL